MAASKLNGRGNPSSPYSMRTRSDSVLGEYGVFWVPASSRSRLEAAYRDIAAKLQLPRHADPNTDTPGLVRN
ncbi:hypothetical protein NKR23_g12129 [Pleurostoma richardsiae]|uniref:Uncharacterized protein n=1 Tax=Pleurostoma richardsiae TaxID=41990 RepID=A0AA38VB17_9PEZI|nr:hypothetical protein NKR23_g12129 [Pleurostoma richardsiae]